MYVEDKDYDGIKYLIEKKSPWGFRLLYTVLVVWALAFMAYFLLGDWSSQGEYARDKRAKEAMLAAAQPKADARPEGTKEEYLAIGKKEYAERCASCHGETGKGGIGPDLTRKDYKYGKTFAALTQSIAEGRPGGMPAFKSDVSHEELEGLVHYLLSL